MRGTSPRFLPSPLWRTIPIRRYCCSFFFSSRRRHTRSLRDWSSDVCSSDLAAERIADLVGEIRRHPAQQLQARLPRELPVLLRDRLLQLADRPVRLTQTLRGLVDRKSVV